MDKHYDVAVYGATMGSNYGGLITYYALYEAIKDMGYSTVYIMPRVPKEGINRTYATDFCEKYHEITERYPLKEFRKHNDIADTFVLGSDQIWNYTLFKNAQNSFYLDFVDDSKKKIAYGASFGFKEPTIFPDYPELYPGIYKLMNRLDYIGVREADAVDVCNEYYDAKAEQVLDPVFLIDSDKYKKLAENAVNEPPKHYMCVYCINPNKEVNATFRFASKTLKLKRVNMGTGKKEKFEARKKMFDEPYLEDVLLEDWINNILKADYVVTDSFHCLCFCILFRKQFVLVQKNWATSRMESLMGMLGLKDRWVQDDKELKERPELLKEKIDYDKVYEKLLPEIEKSKKWLKDSIESVKKVVIDKPIKMDEAETECYEGIRKAQNIRRYLRRINEKPDDYVYMILKRGGRNSLIANFTFPKCLGIGDGKREKIHTKSLSMIVNPQTDMKLYSMSNVSHTSYDIDNVRLSVMAESRAYMEHHRKRSGEFYVEQDGKKYIYTTKEDGLYILTYSKVHKKVVDVSQIIIKNEEETELIHLFREEV